VRSEKKERISLVPLVNIRVVINFLNLGSRLENESFNLFNKDYDGSHNCYGFVTKLIASFKFNHPFTINGVSRPAKTISIQIDLWMKLVSNTSIFFSTID
jgi:hypothetical protein